jgi:RHH-type proline utilization regulon transcriptional repressor/proline dehydrogenase/delta 1-pyrroline-5-carboxylate dehydrogenase
LRAHIATAAVIAAVALPAKCAVVGAQTFGGEGLSGTGSKAGGPHYLARIATERTVTVNTAAVGGVTELLTDRS